MNDNSNYEDSIISEGAEYSIKSEFSKPKLVEEAVRKCIESRSKEMVKGYYNYKFDKNGVPIKIWIPDQREVFNSSVIALRNLLSPEIKNNSEYEKVEEKIKKEIESNFKKYCYTELTPELFDGKIIYKQSENRYIPQKGEQIILKYIRPNGRIEFKETVGGWDRKVDFYLDELVKLNDKLFAALNELIDSLNYFKAKSRF